MNKRMSEELIAPCGINCGVCRFYLGKAKGLYKSKTSGCAGCIPTNEGCNYQGGCEFLNNKMVRFCFECAHFPCKQLEKLNKRYSTKYHTNLIDNLLNIKKNGIGNWLREEEQRWKCRECGGTVSLHTHFCFDCGTEKSS
jgi:hypothetical protein